MVTIIAAYAAFAVCPGQAQEDAPTQKERAAVQTPDEPAKVVPLEGDHAAVAKFTREIVAAREAVFFQTVQVAPPVAGFATVQELEPEREIDRSRKRQERLDSWYRAWIAHWATALELTDQQVSAIDQQARKILETNQGRWERRRVRMLLGDTAVIQFAGTSGPVYRIGRLLHKWLNEHLSARQMEMMEQCQLKRTRRIARWFAERGVAVADAELELTDDQQKECFDDFYRRAQRHGNGLYWFHGRSSYLRYEPLVSLSGRMEAHPLTSVQVGRLHALKDAGTPGNQNENLTVIVGDENSEAVDGASRKVVSRFRIEADRHVAFLVASRGLNEKQRRHLELAARGALLRATKKWKVETLQYVNRFRKQNKGFAFRGGFGGHNGRVRITLAVPEPDRFLRDEIWQRAVERLPPPVGVEFSTKESTVRDGATAFVLGTLDRELFLSEKQIEPLQRLIAMTEPERVAGGQVHLLELAMMGRVLKEINEEAADGILTDAQMVCWQQMKSQYRFKDVHATIPTRDGRLVLMLTDGAVPVQPVREP